MNDAGDLGSGVYALGVFYMMMNECGSVLSESGGWDLVLMLWRVWDMMFNGCGSDLSNVDDMG